MIRSGLDMAGYRVLEAGNLEEAVRELAKQPVDVVVAALGSAARRQLRFACGHAAAAGVGTRFPVLALADSVGELKSSAARGGWAFEDCQRKFDREAVLESVARLASAMPAPRPGRLPETELACVGEER